MKKRRIFEITSDFSMAGSRRMQAPGNLRSGIQTRGSRKNIFDEDDENEVQENSSIPQAVIVLIENEDGEILAVSRGIDMNDMNLPGGSVKLGESLRSAASRELWEETGLRVQEMMPVYSGMEEDGGHFVTVYRVFSYTGNLSHSTEGYPDWVTPRELLYSRYGDFFAKVAKKLNIELF
jgi:8-oxo-dGTP pyrophosphatase MutT (NUDIX family)